MEIAMFKRGIVDHLDSKTLYSVKNDQGRRVCYHIVEGPRCQIVYGDIGEARELLGKPLRSPDKIAA
jgi:hypothetical protein